MARLKEDYCDMFGCESGFFTRDDLNELIDVINEKCPEGLQATEAYMGKDGKTLEVVFDWGEYGQDSVYKKIDMRAIRKPSDLFRYADELIEMGKDKVGYITESLADEDDDKIGREPGESNVSYVTKWLDKWYPENEWGIATVKDLANNSVEIIFNDYPYGFYASGDEWDEEDEFIDLAKYEFGIEPIVNEYHLVGSDDTYKSYIIEFPRQMKGQMNLFRDFDMNESIETPYGPYWYYTKHGVGPGSVPRDITILKYAYDEENDPWGEYFLSDKLITTDDLRRYDLKEKKPPRNAVDKNGELIFQDDDYTPELTTDPMNGGQWYESLTESSPDIEQLAHDLAQFSYDYDPYGFDDAYSEWDSTVEMAIEKSAEDNLSELRENPQGLIEWLQEVIDECEADIEPEHPYNQGNIAKAKELIDRIQALGKNESLTESAHYEIELDSDDDEVERDYDTFFTDEDSARDAFKELKDDERIKGAKIVRTREDHGYILDQEDIDSFGTLSFNQLTESVENESIKESKLDWITLDKPERFDFSLEDKVESFLDRFGWNDSEYNPTVLQVKDGTIEVQFPYGLSNHDFRVLKKWAEKKGFSVHWDKDHKDGGCLSVIFDYADKD